MMAVGLTIVFLLTLLIGALVVGPWLGWHVALQFLYRRYCLFAADPDTDQLDAWDTALEQAHGAGMSAVWREMLIDH